MISRIDDSVDQVDIKVTHDSLVRIRTVGLAPLLVEIALRRHHADHPGELPSWLVGNPELSEAQLVGLVKESEIDLDELGHRQDSAALLELLANRFRYPEAVLTLGKRYYADTCVSAVKFASFLQLHKENEWLLESLARENPSSHEKYLSYTEALKRYPDIQNDLIRIQLSRKRQMEASEATTEAEIRNLYGTGDPAVLRALAANSHTPIDLLRTMESMHGVKFAREIRTLACDTLARHARR